MQPTIRGINLNYSFAPIEERDKTPFGEKDPWSQKLSDTCSVKDPAREVIRQDPKRIPKAIWGDNQRLVSLYEDSIARHVDQRVSLFFQQAIVCHNMPFHFKSSGEAEDQFGASTPLPVQGKRSYQGAHSSTIPCLYAYIKTEWDNYNQLKQQGLPVQLPRRFVYLKHSHGYNLQNSVNDLPIIVNQTDSYIDGKIGQKKLRDYTIHLINRVAQNQLDPIQATREFTNHLRQTVKRAAAHCQARDDDKFYVLEKYRDQVKGIQREIQNSDLIFDRLMGVKIQEGPRASLLRNIVFKRRFEIIRESESVHSQVAYKIDQAMQQLHLSGKGTTDLFKIVLIQQAGEHKKVLEKIFCKNLAALEDNYWEHLQHKEGLSKRSYTTFKNRVNRFLSAERQRVIDNLLRDIRHLFYTLNHKELEFRSGLLRNIRLGFHQWSQQSFSNQFKHLYPGEPMSQAMVSRLEQLARPETNIVYQTPIQQRRKIMTVDKALKVAHTLDVDPGIFFPALFTSAV